MSNYELASANVAVMPVVKGLNKELGKAMKNAGPVMNKAMSTQMSKMAKSQGQVFNKEFAKSYQQYGLLGEKATKKQTQQMTKAYAATSREISQNMKPAIMPIKAIAPPKNNIVQQSKEIGTALGKGTATGFTSAFSASEIGGNLNAALKNVSTWGVNISASAGEQIGKAGNSVRGSISKASSSIAQGFTNGAKMLAGAGVAAGAGLAAAVTGDVLFGGLKRGLDIKNAEAKLRAFGNSEAEIEAVMKSASDAVDGTAYSLDKAALAATSFMTAGYKGGEELTDVLKMVGKTADVTESDFLEIAQILSRAKLSDTIYMEDINMLQDRNFPILAQLEKVTGKTIAQVREDISAGKVDFEMLQAAIDDLHFDSALYATQNAGLAFGNFRSQLKKIGASLWEPITEGLAPFFATMRDALENLQKNPAFQAFIDNFTEILSGSTGKLQGWANKLYDLAKDPEKVGKLLENAGKVINLAVSLFTVGGGLIMGAINTMTTIIAHPITQTIFGWFIDAATYIVNNEALMIAGIGVLLTVFAASKIISLIGVFVGIVSVIGKIKLALAFGRMLGIFGKGLATGAMKMVAGFGTFITQIGVLGSGFIRGLAVIGQAVITGAVHLAALGAFIILVGALIAILSELGVFEVIGDMLTKGMEIISFAIDEILKVLQFFMDNFFKFFELLGGLITESIEPLGEVFVEGLEVFLSGLEKLMPHLEGFINTLATDGLLAAGGALALGLALGSLALGLGAVALSGGLSALIGAITGQGSPLTQLTEFIEQVRWINDEINIMPQEWVGVSEQAMSAGAQIMDSLGIGMVNSLESTKSTVMSSLDSMINDMQARLNAKPLEIKVKSPKMSAFGGGTSGATRVTNNTRSNIFNVDVKNNTAFERILAKEMR